MTDNPKRPLKVFLCHAHSDAAEVRALYVRLKNDGVDAWLDKESLIPGVSWELEIRKAVRESDIVIVCLSKQFNQKGYRQKEVLIALEEASLQPQGEIFIIPAHLEECDYLESLQQYHGVDLFEPQGYDRLMRALRTRAEKIGAELQSKKGWLGSFTSPVKKPVAKKPETVEEKPVAKPTPRKRPQLNIDPKIVFRVFLGIIAVLVVVFGIPRFASYVSQIKFPTPFPTSTSTFIQTFTPSLPTLTFTPVLPTKTNTPVFTPTLKFTATSLPDEITDDKGVRMNLISAGIFKMGNDSYNLGNNYPMHEVYLGVYYMDIYEVTNAAYKLCVEASKCDPPKQSGSNDYNNLEFRDYPVIGVDWYMAKTYCEWRDARLPTEAEWEKAARGTDGRTYPWGEGIDCNYANVGSCNLRNITKVGSYERGKSPYGIYDMAGNVSEWVSSLFKPYPYDANDGRENMSSSSDRIARGGSQNDHMYYGYYYNSSERYKNYPPSFIGLIGIRCARSP